MLKQLLEVVKRILSGEESKDDSDIIREKILSEYKAVKPIYETFANLMRTLIESLLYGGGYKYQLQSRVKEIGRLEEKIRRKQAFGNGYRHLNDIEDLVGLRIIFYTEKDKEAFITDLKKEITGQLRLEEKEKRNGYTATHIIASLGKKRLKLIEYMPFAELRCEIQITSAIHHAWAEVEHDIIYKDINELEKSNPEKYKLVKEKLEVILEKHIKKASDEFEEVIKEIEGAKT